MCGRNRATWQLTGTWAGTVHIQGSLDGGTTWANLDGGQTPGPPGWAVDDLNSL